jgi:cysteine-rich repeat protein
MAFDAWCGHVRCHVTQCDDANGQSGDGCSDECTIEEGFDCKFGNRFTHDICTPLPASVGTSPRRDIGGVGGSGSVRVRGAQRKLLQSSVRIAVRMSRGRAESSGMPLMVEGYMWSLSDDR